MNVDEQTRWKCLSAATGLFQPTGRVRREESLTAAGASRTQANSPQKLPQTKGKEKDGSSGEGEAGTKTMKKKKGRREGERSTLGCCCCVFGRFTGKGWHSSGRARLAIPAVAGWGSSSYSSDGLGLVSSNQIWKSVTCEHS